MWSLCPAWASRLEGVPLAVEFLAWRSLPTWRLLLQPQQLPAGVPWWRRSEGWHVTCGVVTGGWEEAASCTVPPTAPLVPEQRLLQLACRELSTGVCVGSAQFSSSRNKVEGANRAHERTCAGYRWPPDALGA